MRYSIATAILLTFSMILAGCGKDEVADLVCGEIPPAAGLAAPSPQNATVDATVDATVEGDTGGYLINIAACERDPTHIFMVIETNLPLPVEVVAGVNLVTRAPGEIYIGHAERVQLNTAQTVHELDLTRVNPPLRGGAYEARVGFFAASGTVAENPAAASVPDLWAATPLVLTGTEPAAEPSPDPGQPDL